MDSYYNLKKIILEEKERKEGRILPSENY